MEVDLQKINIEQLTLTFVNDVSSGQNEIAILASILKKWIKEARKVGFRKTYNSDEQDLIEQLYEQLIGDESQTVQNVSGGPTFVQETL